MGSKMWVGGVPPPPPPVWLRYGLHRSLSESGALFVRNEFSLSRMYLSCPCACRRVCTAASPAPPTKPSSLWYLSRHEAPWQISFNGMQRQAQPAALVIFLRPITARPIIYGTDKYQELWNLATAASEDGDECQEEGGEDNESP